MSILSAVLLLHKYVVTNLNNYCFSSGIVDDSSTHVQAQSPATSLKIIAKLNSFFCGLTAKENVLFKSNHNKSFCGNRIINTSGDPVKTEIFSNKQNPILTLLITARGTDVKYAL
jgi:hypothetical protein